MAIITGFDGKASVIGTTQDDTIIYDPSNDGDSGSEPLPSGLDVNGRAGNDVFDWVSGDEGALLTDAYGATYDSGSGILTIPGVATFTSIEEFLFENGTLDLTGPIAGQTFFDLKTSGATDTKNGKLVFNQVDDVFETVDNGGGIFGVAAVSETTPGDYDYTTVNGQTLSGGGVSITTGKGGGDVVGQFTVKGGNLNFEADTAFLAGLTEDYTFTAEVGIVEDDDPLNTQSATYTVTVTAPGAVPPGPFVFTEGDDTTYNFDASVPGGTPVDGALPYTDALGGNDFVTGSEGIDLLFLNDGDDSVFGGSLDASGDIFVGGDGNDVIGGAAGNDFLIGDSAYGNPTAPDAGAAGDDGSDEIFGGIGDDIIIGGSATGMTLGGTINGSPNVDTGLTFGYTGTVEGTAADILWGGEGNDSVLGAGGDDKIGLGIGNDYAEGGAGSDTIYGSDGMDNIFGGLGSDELWGGNDVDFLDGGSKNDTLGGGAGDDVLFGGSDQDSLTGGEGNDVLSGDTGSDTLNGGEGDDILMGSVDSDTFEFDTNGGTDLIADFNVDEDVIDISSFATNWAFVESVAYQVDTTVFIEMDATTTIAIATGASPAPLGSVVDLDASLFVFA